MNKLFILTPFVCLSFLIAHAGELHINDRKVTYDEWSSDVEVQVPGPESKVSLQTRTTQFTMHGDRRFPIQKEIKFAHVPNSRIGWVGEQSDKLVVAGNQIVGFSIDRSILQIRTSIESPVTRSVKELMNTGIKDYARSFEDRRSIPDLAVYLPLIFGLSPLEDPYDSRPHSLPSAHIDEVRVLENSISLRLTTRVGRQLVLELNESFKPVAASVDAEAVPILDHGFIRARKTPPRSGYTWGPPVKGTIDSSNGPVVVFKRTSGFDNINVHGTEENFSAQFIYVPDNGSVWIGRQPQRVLLYNGKLIGLESTGSKLLVITQSKDQISKDESLPDAVQERLNLFSHCVQNRDFGRMEVINLPKIFGDGEFTTFPTIEEILFEGDKVTLKFRSDYQRDLTIILDSEMVPRQAIMDGTVKPL